jgi:hypothetical protein
VKKKAIIAILIVISFFIVIIVSIKLINYSIEKDNIIPEPKYYSKDELTVLFYANSELFDDIAQIMLRNNYFFTEGKKDPRWVRITYFSSSPKEYFSETEWEKIVEFFCAVQALDIMRYNGKVIGIHFSRKDGHDTDMFYFPDSLYDLGHRTRFYDEVTSLGDGWYIAERYDSISKNRFIYNSK